MQPASRLFISQVSRVLSSVRGSENLRRVGYRCTFDLLVIKHLEKALELPSPSFKSKAFVPRIVARERSEKG